MKPMELGPLAQAPAPVPREQAEMQRNLIRAVSAVNESEMLGEQNELTFALDRNSRRPVLRIVDRRTGELIRQIPPEEVLRMAQRAEEGAAVGD